MNTGCQYRVLCKDPDTLSSLIPLAPAAPLTSGVSPEVWGMSVLELFKFHCRGRREKKKKKEKAVLGSGPVPSEIPIQ